AGPVKSRRISGARKAHPKVSASLPTIPAEEDPPAWANYRSEMGDALPWFRAVQGGIYHKDGVCWGVLVDADSGDRSYIDDEVVITRIGGGCTKDADGNLVHIRDQDMKDAMVKSVFNSMEQKIPVGIIVGHHNTVLKTKVPHPFNVLDYFRVAHVWFEIADGFKAAKVRFEKLDLSTKSWWAAKGALPPTPLEDRDFQSRPESTQCCGCGHSSFKIYNQGWMCLDPSCDLFFTMGGSVAPTTLTYTQEFLNYRMTPDASIEPHHSLIPDLLSTLDEDDTSTTTCRVAWKGIVCPQCHKCISRRFWEGWKCSDSYTPTSHTCTFEKMFKMHPVSMRSVIDSLEISPRKRALIADDKFMTPTVNDVDLAPYRMLVYNLAGVGHITHLVSNREINGRPNGPNAMFQQLQQAKLGLERYPLSQSVVGGTLTAHFAANYVSCLGMPYKYVAPVNSKAFSEAPDVVLHALGRLKWATENAVRWAGGKALPPNEMLVLGYMEAQKIGYHDDGESSLGPTIATMSLGARSTMLVRMKSKYFNGRSKGGVVLKEDPVIQGCALQPERKALKTAIEKGELNEENYAEEYQRIWKKHRYLEAKPCIKLELNHGDLVVMHDEKLQKYYEHSVIPENKLRYALTARHIKADYVDSAEAHKGNFQLEGDQVYDGK
ncbi:2OG-Fe(II) oxygenase superfamily-domain-containing protein, partial [Aspergillus coremiiformis]